MFYFTSYFRPNGSQVKHFSFPLILKIEDLERVFDVVYVDGYLPCRKLNFEGKKYFSNSCDFQLS